MQPATNDLLLTINETAQRLRLSRSLIYRLLAQGELQSVRIGAARRIIASSLDHYVERLARAAADAGAEGARR